MKTTYKKKVNGILFIAMSNISRSYRQMYLENGNIFQEKSCMKQTT